MQKRRALKIIRELVGDMMPIQRARLAGVGAGMFLDRGS